MVACAGILYAWKKAGNLQGRVRELAMVQAALRKLRTRIFSCREPLQEALEVLGEEDALLSYVGSMLDQGTEAAWREAIADMPCLSGEDRTNICALTDSMGQLSWQKVCAAMDQTDALLCKTLEEARQQAQREGKLYRTLGMLAAAAALILGM